MTERVEEADVLIYPVGMFESGGISSRELLKLGIGIRETDPQLELERLAQATGTKAHFPKDVEQCKTAMREISREVSQQYSVGYYPANTPRDGKWHRIQVTVGEPKTAYAAAPGLVTTLQVKGIRDTVDSVREKRVTQEAGL